MSADVYLLATEQYDGPKIEHFLQERCASVFACIKPGMRVVIKPNWVCQGDGDPQKPWQAVITHPEIITAVLKVVLTRLDGSGAVLLCDGPQTDSSFARLLARYPVESWKWLCDKNKISFQILDLREDEWETKRGIVVSRKKLPGDPLGSTEVNLKGELSEFWGHQRSSSGYYGADYDIAEVNAAHNGHDNLYRVSRSVMQADVLVNLPKLKTHLKAGITANLKNLVGINTYKNFLPHYSLGCPDEGGDQFPTAQRRQRLEASGGKWLKQRMLTFPILARLFSFIKPLLGKIMGKETVIRSGCWQGNDTIWRMILDLNKIFFYADPEGRLPSEGRKRDVHLISVVDAVIAGQGDGPLNPRTCPLGLVLCGDDPVVVDAVCARSMGFDTSLIPTLSRAWEVQTLPLTAQRPEDVRVLTEEGIYDLSGLKNVCKTRVTPARGWEILAESPAREAQDVQSG